MRPFSGSGREAGTRRECRACGEVPRSPRSIPPGRDEDRLEIGRGASVSPRAPAELSGRLEIEYPPPAQHGVAIALLFVQEHAVIVEGPDVRRIEPQNAPKG